MASETAQTVQAKQKIEAEARKEANTKAQEDIKVEAKAEAPASELSRVGRADAIIRRNALWALGAGLVPVPFADIAALTAVQIKLLKELSDLYEVRFFEGIGKKLIGSLLSGVGTVTIGVAIGSSLSKLLPGVGTAIGIVAMPVLAGAATLAMGKVFLMHFESGGTILDFDPYAMRSYFKKEFEKAKETMSKIQQEEHAKGASHTT